MNVLLEKRERWALLVLLMAVVGMYSLTINGSFLYDDILQIQANETLRHLSQYKEIFFHAGRETRPLLNFFYAIAWNIAPEKTWPFHTFLIFVHALNTGLVFRLVKKMFLAGGKPNAVATWTATILFAFHPLQVQGVSYIVGATSAIQCFFFVACLNLFDSGNVKNDWPIRFILGFSMLCKESCLLIPFVLAWWDFTFGEFSFKKFPYRRHLSFIISSLIVMLPLYALVTNPIEKYDDSTGFHLYPYGQYLFVQGYNYLLYLWLLFDSSMQSLIHPFPKVNSTIMILGVLGWQTYIVMVFFAFRERIRFPVFSFLVGFFCLSLVLTNTLLQMSNPFAEYRLYQANIASFVGIGFVLSQAIGLVKRPVLRYLALGAPLVWLLWSCFLMQSVWKNDAAIYVYSLSVYPESYELVQLLGAYYESKNQIDLAEEQYLKAIPLFKDNHGPVFFHPYRLLFRIYYRSGQWDKALVMIKLIEDKLSDGKLPVLGFQSYLRILKAKNDEASYNAIREKALRFYPEERFLTWGEAK